MIKEEKRIENYCNTLYTELEGVKAKLNDLIAEIEGFSAEEGVHVKSHADHLKKIIDTIDWKLEVFTKVCPLDSGGYSKGAVENVSVPILDPDQFSGGYLGG